ncbi:hypothetical protein PZE06_04845 [Robertmurraya sp. DFI.2.37]|jgi:hypothetical protein|uniref:hypothetical protein n=1 Tax=Robertmurraya sp. DFI.2.37 TaxID=3031819 RepID=UPI0012490DBD|nr:hypothetical protein [Robertmurraya sp. DFI.2.37]MDF1507510.1 hypothetical protein [Robertmurraya sp. DFI.2.37]
MSEVGYECPFGMGARRLGVKTTEHDTEIISGKTKVKRLSTKDRDDYMTGRDWQKTKSLHYIIV